MKDAKLIYADSGSLAYEKKGVRYSIMHARGKVLITEMKDGQLSEYLLELDDAVACLRSSPEAGYAVQFIRKIKRQQAVAQITGSLKILVKLFAHIILSLVAGFIVGYFCNMIFGG